MKIQMLLALAAWVINSTTIMAQETIKQTAGRDQLGDFAPKFAELNDDVLFGEVWSRTDKLGLRDRSLVTITSLISQGITDSSLTYHLQTAKQNGITVRKSRNHYAHCLLCRMAESMGRFPSGQGSLGGRCNRRRGKGSFPARNDFPNRRTEYRICTILYRSELPGSGFEGTGAGVQCDL